MKEHLEQRIHDLAEYLIQLEQDAKLKKQKRAKSSVAKFHLSMGWLCKKLLASYVASAETGMRISKDKNRYTKGRYVPEGVTYDITIDGVLPLMLMDGFVREVRKGSYDRTKGEGKQTRIAATGKLVDWFDVDPVLLPKALVGCEDADPIVLQKKVEREVTDKDGVVKTIIEKKKLFYGDTPQIISWRDNLTIINDCIKRHWADLYLTDDDWVKLNTQLLKDEDHDYSPIQLHRQTLRRVFNSTFFDEGGRFYGAWWQNIPSAYRAYVTIDGKFTDEFDYGHMHPTMLYARQGLMLKDDAYEIGIGSQHRDIVKQTFNAMVQMKQPSNTPPRDIDFKSTGRTWKQIRERILEKHEPIKDSFFCSKGNRLQFEDSQLAEQLMLHFANRDIPVLPVHDSFLIIRGLSHELENVMHEEFEKMFNMPINIDDSAKVSPVSFPPEDVDVDWIVSETDSYQNWEKRNKIQRVWPGYDRKKSL